MVAWRDISAPRDVQRHQRWKRQILSTRKRSPLCLCFDSIQGGLRRRSRCMVGCWVAMTGPAIWLSWVSRGENAKSWDGPRKDNCIVSALEKSRYDFEGKCISFPWYHNWSAMWRSVTKLPVSKAISVQGSSLEERMFNILIFTMSSLLHIFHFDWGNAYFNQTYLINVSNTKFDHRNICTLVSSALIAKPFSPHRDHVDWGSVPFGEPLAPAWLNSISCGLQIIDLFQKEETIICIFSQFKTCSMKSNSKEHLFQEAEKTWWNAWWQGNLVGSILPMHVYIICT